jgi:hypothetical protein
MSRVLPDIHDIIVWRLNETSGAYRNTGSQLPNDATTDLSITNTIIRTGSGLFDNSCPQIPGTVNFPTGALATRNYIAGAKTITPATPMTLSCWVNLRYYNTSNNSTFISKEYRDSSITSSWTSPFHAIGITTLTGNSGQDWVVNVAINSSTQVSLTVTDFPIPIGMWSHIGITHDGTAIRAFLNGCQCIYYSGATQLNSTSASTISYTDGVNGFGYWKIGAITATGSSNKEEPNCSIQDVRIANVARPLSYFKNIYKTGALALSISSQIQYYKLRAYDTSCGSPTSVTWVDTQISLTNAPAFPCTGPYSAPEVLDTWFQ